MSYQRFLLYVLILLPVWAQSTPLQEQLNSFLEHNLPHSQVGVMLQDAATGTVLYQRHAQRSFLPASTTKLFTAVSALLVLKADYRYETSLHYDPTSLKEGVLHGDVYLHFTGDPSLTTSDLKNILHHLTTHNIQKIEGNLYLDGSRFQGPEHALGWLADDLNWYSGAPISALSLDHNQATITIQTSPGLNQAVHFQSQDPTLGLHLQSEVRTVTAVSSLTECQLNIIPLPHNSYQYKGCWPVDTNITAYIALRNMASYINHQITHTLLPELGIQLSGEIKQKTTPQDMPKAYTWYSQTLQSLLSRMLRRSDNLYAESFIKTMGHHLYGAGTFQRGTQAIIDSIEPRLPVSLQHTTRLFDGSGLSRYNLISPYDLNQLLLLIYQSPELYPIIQDSLPLSGYQGNLKNRLNTPYTKGKILAKSGSQTHHSSLSGYLTTQKGQVLIFTIMIGNALKSTKELRYIEDKFCELASQI